MNTSTFDVTMKKNVHLQSTYVSISVHLLLWLPSKKQFSGKFLFSQMTEKKLEFPTENTHKNTRTLLVNGS